MTSRTWREIKMVENKTGATGCVGSRLTAIADVIVGVEMVHDGVEVGAHRIQATDLRAESFEVLRVTDWLGLKPGAPGADFMRSALLVFAWTFTQSRRSHSLAAVFTCSSSASRVMPVKPKKCWSIGLPNV